VIEILCGGGSPLGSGQVYIVWNFYA